MSSRGFLIAAPQSGSGKTTVSLAVMAALARRGMAVAPFKCGPDFIDPGYHRLVTGRPSINLDAWMCQESFVRSTFRFHTESANVAIIEGAMGLFDGIGGEAMNGSSARIAAITGAPVVLVVNARGMAASAAALVDGFARFDPQVQVKGVIFNNTGSGSHGELLREALARYCPGISCVGAVPRDEALMIPSRHLGLVTAEDNPLPVEFVTRLADMAESCLDLDTLAGLQLPPCPPFIGGERPVFHKADPPVCETGRRGGLSPVRIAVARDAAFCFCYPDNLRLLQDAGAEVVPFSPLKDGALPPDIAGIYLPGGYPELHAGELAANLAMKESVCAAIRADMPVYAECGGFIYLTEGMATGEGFSGVFPVRTRMLPKRKALGYRQVELCRDAILGTGGQLIRGHEFHYSEPDELPASVARIYRVSRRGEVLGSEGYQVRNCLASYIHLHFGSNPAVAPAFVSACTRWRSMLKD